VNHEHLYLIIPYLTCHQRFRIRGIEFRNSGDLADLPSGTSDHLRSLCDMFYLQHGVRMKNMTCAVLPIPHDATERRRQIGHIREAHLLIGYLYSAPQPSGGVFLPAESSSLYSFTVGDSPTGAGQVPSSLVWQGKHLQDRVELDGTQGENDDDFIPGYVGMRNGTETFWVAKGSRIFPQPAHVSLNFSQELSAHLNIFLSRPQNWAFRYLYESNRDMTALPEVQIRVFVGLEWYLRSCKTSISAAEEIVNVAIALESLLRIRAGEGLTERFKDAVTTLVGPVARLDSWLEQFYAARSRVVHEGVPHRLEFLAADREAVKKKKINEEITPHRSLIEYARRIFRICLTAVVSSAMHATMAGFPGLFIHNQERLTELSKILSDKATDATKRIAAVERHASELQENATNVYESSIELSRVLGVAKLLLEAYSSLPPPLSSTVLGAMKEFILSTEPDPQRFKRLQQCATLIQAEYAHASPAASQSLSIIITFLAYATSPGFSFKALASSSTSAAAS